MTMHARNERQSSGTDVELSTDAVRSLASLFAVGRQRRRMYLGEVRVSQGVAKHHSVVTVVLQHAFNEVEQLTVVARVRHHVSLQSYNYHVVCIHGKHKQAVKFTSPDQRSMSNIYKNIFIRLIEQTKTH